MKKYHDQLTIRERIAKPFYKLPELPIPFERFLALKLIPFIEGPNPHYEHLGLKCPCMKEENNEI